MSTVERHFYFNFFVIINQVLSQGARMEERLDDAINVLRNHAEAPDLYPQELHPHQAPPGNRKHQF